MSIKVFAENYQIESSKWQWTTNGVKTDIANLNDNQLRSGKRILMKQAYQFYKEFGTKDTDWEFFVHPLYWALNEELERRSAINEWVGN